METKQIKYEEFWNWFEKCQNLLEEVTLTHPIISEIDIQVKKLGDFTWEIGPGIDKPYSFTLSPGGDMDLLTISKEIISFSPSLKEWEFYHAKPQKDWDKYFDVIINDKKIRIDISEWEYVLLQYEDDTFDIDIRPVPYFDYYDDDKYGIVDMVLCSLIGEENRITKFVELNVVKEFEPETERSKSHLVNLPDHLKKIFQ